MARLNVSNDRLCIPAIDEEFAKEAIAKLVSIERDWIPSGEGRLFISARSSSAWIRTSVCIRLLICCSW